MTTVGVAERLSEIRERVEAAAARAGRPGGARLLAVSKTQTTDAIREAYAAGQRDFAENYVQELARKADELAELTDARFHLIGHLQSNKAKQAVRVASAIHTVDSPELARELDKRFDGLEIPAARWAFGDDARLPVLVEVSIAGEAQKSGCAPDALAGVLDAIDGAPRLRLVGLMCVPPFTQDPAASRPHFEALARLRDAHGGPERLPELSMGMTADFEHAIAAGATIVRVGTAIFGARPTKMA
ncbi:MAG TPA: YggS family pyridoxal phosphate-dependent enzyme [Polyangiaceae bacterium]